MPNIRTSIEPKRGCGYRNEGGLYLVGPALSAPCCRLPILLDRCPACGAGIKPSRGFQWVDPRQFLSGMKDMLNESCDYCVMGDDRLPPRAGLIWIGGKFYSTAEEFRAEAAKMGVSRRIKAVPREFEVGKTLVLLAHRALATRACGNCEGIGVMGAANEIKCEECKGKGSFLVGGIFAAFIPTAVEYIIGPKDSTEHLDKLEARGIQLVKVVRDVDVQLGLEFESEKEKETANE